MNYPVIVAAGVLATGVALVACGGGAKDADSPGTCPAGTVLKGSDCVPAESAGDTSSSDDSVPKRAKHDDDKPATPAAGGTGDSSPTASSGDDKAAYDKDAVNVELKRAVRQVKANCGSATDDEGNKTGPWGTTKATVVLGRNGHVKQVTVPAPYDGKPVGVCVVHAFEKIQFPPYAGSTDAVVDWDVELVEPKKHK